MLVRQRWLLIVGVLLLCVMVGGVSFAQQSAAATAPDGGMSAWQIIKAGGGVMAILVSLSVFTIALIIYCFMTVSETKLLPAEFCNRVIQKLSTGRRAEVKEICETQKDNIMSRILLPGLEKYDQDPVFAKEVIEQKARAEINHLWRQIGYLSDIGTVAPLLGLLGTVIGMIEAFNVIAFQAAGVKPILLAGGVAKAMVTTAGGLVVAIPAVIAHSYFKKRVQIIADSVEMYYTDMIRFLEE